MYARGTTTMNTAAPSKTHSNIFSNLSRQRRRQALYNAHAEAKSQSKVNYLLTLVLIRSRFWHVLFLVLRIFFLSLHSEMENGMMHSTRACIFSFSFILWIFQWQKWKQHSGIALPAAVASTSMQNNNRVRWKWQNPITLMHRRDAISSNMHYMYRFIVMHAHRTRNVYARLPGARAYYVHNVFFHLLIFVINLIGLSVGTVGITRKIFPIFCEISHVTRNWWFISIPLYARSSSIFRPTSIYEIPYTCWSIYLRIDKFIKYLCLPNCH